MMPAGRDLILYRIDHWNELCSEIGNKCAQVAGADFKFLVDESGGSVDTGGVAKIAGTVTDFTALGLITENDRRWKAADAIWYNKDYMIYAAYMKFPCYENYWLIEQNTLINFTDYNDFFERFSGNHTDFLGTAIQRATPSWEWHQAAAGAFPEVWSVFWPIMRLSNRATGYALAKRLIAAHRYRQQPSGEGAAWPFCEAWLASEICTNDNLTFADLNSLVTCYDHPAGGYGTKPQRRYDLLQTPADRMIRYPVLDDDAYLQWAFQSHLSGGGRDARQNRRSFFQILSRCRERPQNRTRCRALAARAADAIDQFKPARIGGRTLRGSDWWLGRADGSMIAEALAFHPDGVLSTAAGGEPGGWALDDGGLVVELPGMPAIRFAEKSRYGDAGPLLRGRADGSGDSVFILGRDAVAERAHVPPEPAAPSASCPPDRHDPSAARAVAAAFAGGALLSGAFGEEILRLRERVAALTHSLEPLPATGAAAATTQPPALVSIVLPVYNQGDLVEEALAGIFSQSYPHWELIVIDDGSADDLAERLRPFAGDRRILFLRQDNQKLPAALNNAFRHVRGELVTWTSADNVMLPTQLEKLVAALQQHPAAGLVYSDYWAIDDKGDPLSEPNWRPHNRDPEIPALIRLPGAVSIDNFHLSGDNFIGASFLYRRSLMDLVGQYSDAAFGGEDYDYWLRMHLATQFCHVREPLYRYRVHDNTISAHAAEMKLFDNLRETREMARWRVENLLTEARLSQGDGVLRPGDQYRAAILEQCRPLRYSELDRQPEPARGLPLVIDIDAPLWAVDSRRLAGADVLLCRSDLIYQWARREPWAEHARVLRWDGELGAFQQHAFVQVVAEKAAGAPHGWRSRPRPRIDAAFVPRSILHIVDVWSHGGLENMVLDLCRQLAIDGCSVFLAAARGPAPSVELTENGPVIPQLSFGGDAAAFVAFLRERNIAVVNYHHCAFAVRSAQQESAAAVYTMHNSDLWLHDAEREQLRQAFTDIGAVIAVSRQVAHFAVQQYGVPADRMTVVPNGLPDRTVACGPRPDLAAGTGFRVVMVASFVPLKLQHVAVAAFCDAADEMPELRLRMIGGRTDETYLRMLRATIAASRHSERIELLAELSREATLDELMQSHVFILPSAIEGWSLALMEAIDAGCVCIASDVGGARDLHVDHGSLVLLPAPLGDFSQVSSHDFYRAIASDLPQHRANLANALRRVRRHYQQFAAGVPQTRARLREMCSMRRMADAYLETYTAAYRTGSVLPRD